MKKLAVIGSINMDVVTRVERFPKPGETLTGTSFSTIPGGKGANQAVALGRLGMPVRMAGCVGDDAFGDSYLRNFRENGVDTSLVRVRKGQTTGTASIEVNAEGENHIIVVAAANGECGMEWLEGVLPALADSDIFLLQHEIPLPVVHEAIRRLHAMGKTVILDPAPAAAVPEDVLAMVDYITPNESELRAITPHWARRRMRRRASSTCSTWAWAASSTSPAETAPTWLRAGRRSSMCPASRWKSWTPRPRATRSMPALLPAWRSASPLRMR